MIKKEDINEYKNISSKYILSNTYTYESTENKNEVDNNIDFKYDAYVIGKLEIPKINLQTDILPQSNDENLKKSIARLSGPKIVNTRGNLCIAGHNYINANMFGKLYKLNINDKIYITGLDNNTLEYTVYEKFKTSPNDISCLNFNEEKGKEVTLITCTITGLERLIIKASVTSS